MYLITWIALGLVVGFIASKIVQRHGKGIVLDLTLGVAGALAGGYLAGLFTSFTHNLRLDGILAAVAGATAVLLINHGIRRGLADRLT